MYVKYDISFIEMWLIKYIICIFLYWLCCFKNLFFVFWVNIESFKIFKNKEFYICNGIFSIFLKFFKCFFIWIFENLILVFLNIIRMSVKYMKIIKVFCFYKINWLRLIVCFLYNLKCFLLIYKCIFFFLNCNVIFESIVG